MKQQPVMNRFTGIILLVMIGVVGTVPAFGETVLSSVKIGSHVRAQIYEASNYLWLGVEEVTVTFQVKPQTSHAIEVMWGSKDDMRQGQAVINGKASVIKAGGYRGFRPVRIPVPVEVKGDTYTIVFKRTAQPFGFFSEVRLIETTDGSGSPLVKGAFTAKAIAPSLSAPRPRAFLDKRPFWDTPFSPVSTLLADAKAEAAFQKAEKNGRQANEMFFRSRKFVSGWLAQADPKSGLIPRNLTSGRHFWNGKDSAADNYPFMVLTCSFTDREMFDGVMLDMLKSERRLTSRLGPLPDAYSFPKQDFLDDKVDVARIMFESSEYVKDGLLPLTEWLGESPWRDRMIEIVDEMWKRAPIETPYGKIVSTNIEVNGEMLQALSRIYWMQGDRKYLDWAIRLGDYYLLGDKHPTRNTTSLRLRDHGCEVVSGLSELYATCNFARPAKKKEYEPHIHEMFDRILEVGRTPEGMLYDTINPKTGSHSNRICDTWGYNYNGIYTVYMIDKTPAYREAVRKALGNMKEHLIDYNWGGVADEYADSIEGGINLFNRERVASIEDWFDSEIPEMWAKQREDGVIEGWHGDGNIARTAIMYALFKTQGLTLRPWREDLRVGAVEKDGMIYVSLVSSKPWEGRLVFDTPRHKTQMHMPLDYPRINQFPEWFTVKRGKKYEITTDLTTSQGRILEDRTVSEGLNLNLDGKHETRFTLREK